MKNYYFLILVLLASLASRPLCCQTLTPFEFEEFTPLWSHYFMADPLSDTIQNYHPDGFPNSRGDILEKDNYIYITNNINHTNDFQGYVIEKLDVSSGDQIWEYVSYQDTVGAREISSNAYIEDDILHLMIYKEKRPNPWFPLWRFANVGQRSFDINSGQLTNSKQTDKNDPLNKEIMIPWFVFSTPELTSSRLYPSENGYKYIAQLLSLDTDEYAFSYRLYNLDEDGHVLNTKEYKKTLGQSPYGLLTQELDDKTFFTRQKFAIGTDSLGNDITETKYKILDRDLNITNEGVGLVYRVNSKHRHMAYYNSQIANDSTRIVNYKLTDYDGYLLDSLVIVIDSFKRQSVQGLSTGKLLSCIGSIEDGYKHFSFYTSDGNGNPILEKNVKITDKTQDVRLDGFFEVANGNILVRFSHTDLNHSLGSYAPRWVNYVMFSAESLGLKTALVDYEKRNSDFEISPNPSKSILNIRNNSSHDAQYIRIINSTSRVIYESNFSSTVNINNFENGMYIIAFYNKNKGFIESKKFIKI